MTLNSQQFKSDSNTQVSFRNPSINTLQGNSGGLSLLGGTAISDNLILKANNQTFAGGNSGRINCGERIVWNVADSNVLSTITFLTNLQSYILGTTFVSVQGFDWGPTVSSSFNPGVAIFPAFWAHNTLQATGTWTGSLAFVSCAFLAQPVFDVNGSSISPRIRHLSGFQAEPQSTLTSGTAGTIDVMSPFTSNESPSSLVPTHNAAGITVTKYAHYLINDVRNSGTITNHIGLDIPDISTASTLAAGVRCTMTSGTGRWFIYETGNADNSLKGNLRLGDNTAPTALLDIAGVMTVSSSGLVKKYNNITTVSNGVPSILATIDLTAVASSKVAQALYTPTAAGMFRISVVLTLTRAATTSSTLAGTAAGQQGVSVTFKTGDGSTTVTQTIPLTTQAGTAIVNTSTANTVGTTLIGHEVIYTDASAITYDIGYTSVGATTMQYSIHMKVEAL